MATTASVHTNTYGGRTITLTVSEISTSIDNNTSTIQWTLTSGTSSTYHSVYDITAWVGGTASSNKVYGPKTADWSSRAFPCKDGSTSGTLTIQHNADGTASPVPFRLRGSVFNNNPQNYDGSIDLTTIPRASTFTLSKTSGGTATTSFSLGDAIYVNITRASNTFTHKVYFVIGSSGNQVLSNSATTSANTTLAASLAQYIPSASGTATMYVDTYSGSTLIGSKSSTFTISVPANVLPSITSVTKTDTSNLLASYGAYVQGKSSLRVQTAASGNYSSITNYSVKLKNGNTILQTKTGSDVTFSNITYTGTIAVEVTVTDSRNRTATNSSNITIAAYSNPSASINAERRNNDDVVTLVFSGTITNINSANVNGKTFTLEKKKKTDNTWTTLETYTSDYNYSSNSYTTSCDSDYAWDFRLIATDSFTSAKATTDVGTAFELVNYGADGTSIGFGKVAETSNTFECNLDTDFKKAVTIRGNNDISGNVTISGNNTVSGNVSISGTSTFNNKLIIPQDNTIGIFNPSNNNILKNNTSNDTILNATGGLLYLGLANTTNLNFLNGNGGSLDTSGNLTIGNVKTRNLFNYDVYDNRLSTMTKTPSINGFTITASQYANSSGIKLKEFCPQMEVGKTYFLSGTTTSTNAKYIYIGETWNYGSSKTITQTMLDTNVSFYGLYNQPSATGTVTISNIQIEEGTKATSFSKFQAVGNTFGSNGNGYYIRFPSLKLQICYITRDLITGSSTTSINSTGNVYYIQDTWTFPVAFSSAPIVIVGAIDRASGVYGACSETPTTTNVVVTAYGPAASRATGYSAIAIGSYT